jgi:hypothetical protein
MSCLLVLHRDTSRGVQSLGYKAQARRRLKNLLCLARTSDWRYVLRGSYPSFYSAKVLSVINLGKGLSQTCPKERYNCPVTDVDCLGPQREEAPVHESGWGRLTSFPSALHRPRPSFRESSNRRAALCGCSRGGPLLEKQL